MQQDSTRARAEELRCADCGEAFDDTRAYLRHRTERHGDEVHVNSRGVSSLEPAGTARAEAIRDEHPSEQTDEVAEVEPAAEGGGAPSGDAGVAGSPPRGAGRDA